jgi:cell division protein FtsB
MTLQFRLPAHLPHFLLATLILLLLLVTIVGERGALHLWRLRGEKTQLDEQNYLLQKANEELRQKITRIRSDNRYLEKLAREELNMVRPGEVVYRFPRAEPRPGRTPPVSESAAQLPPSAAQKSPR